MTIEVSLAIRSPKQAGTNVDTQSQRLRFSYYYTNLTTSSSEQTLNPTRNQPTPQGKTGYQVTTFLDPGLSLRQHTQAVEHRQVVG